MIFLYDQHSFVIHLEQFLFWQMATPSSTIRDVSYTSEFESKYQKGMEMSYKLDGKPCTGEFNQKMGSVSILLFDRDLDSFLLVRQFRPAIFTSIISRIPENYGKDFNKIAWDTYDPEIGYTVELCAGLIDKENMSPAEIATEEVAEECGYLVKPQNLIPIAQFVVGAHQSGNAQHMFYVEIGKDMKISEGGGNVHEGEVISKVYITKEEARRIARPTEDDSADVKGPPGVLFAFQWWFLSQDQSKKEFIANPPKSYVWYPQNPKLISDVTFDTDYDKKKYGYNPKRMKFTLNGFTRTWDLALCPNTTACILVDMPKKELVLLQTLRPPVFVGKTRNLEQNDKKQVNEIDYSQSDPKFAYTLELPVNRVPEGDDPRKFVRIAVKQLGYDLKEPSFRLLGKCVPGIGQSGDTQHIFTADIGQALICEKEVDEDVEELRVAFADLPDLFKQSLIGPPTTYYAIGFVIDQLIDKTIE